MENTRLPCCIGNFLITGRTKIFHINASCARIASGAYFSPDAKISKKIPDFYPRASSINRYGIKMGSNLILADLVTVANSAKRKMTRLYHDFWRDKSRLFSVHCSTQPPWHSHSNPPRPFPLRFSSPSTLTFSPCFLSVSIEINGNLQIFFCVEELPMIPSFNWS